MRRLMLTVTVLYILGSVVGIAQQPPAPLRFEVASIRPNKSPATYPTVTGRTPSRYAITSATLVDVIMNAYSFRWSSVVGGPDWVRLERFDIVATAPGQFVFATSSDAATQLTKSGLDASGPAV